MYTALDEIKSFWNFDKKSYLMVAVFAFIFYLPRVKGIDLGSILSVLVATIGFTIRVKNYSNVKINLLEVFFIALIFFELIFLALKPELNLISDSYYLMRVIRSTSVIYIYYLAIYYFNISFYELFKIVFLVLVGHFLLVYLQYFSSGEFKIFFLKLNPIYDPSVNPSEFQDIMVKGTRVKGVMNGFDGAGLLIANLFGMSLAFFKNNKTRFVWLVSCLIGCLITSRTGLVILIFIASIFYIKLFYRNKKMFWISVIGLSFGSLVSLFVLFQFFTDSVFVQKTLRNSFEIYYNYKEKKEVKLNSFDDMIKNHYVISKRDISFLGQPEKQVYRSDGKILTASQSDVGYLQLLANFGIPIFMLIIFFHLFALFNLYKKVGNIFDVRFILILAFLIACFKGPYFFNRLIYDIICLIFFGIGFKKNEEDNRNFLI